MPSLLLAVPTSPHASQETDGTRENAEDAPHEGDGKADRTSIRADHFVTENETTNGGASPSPHSDEIADCKRNEE